MQQHYPFVNPPLPYDYDALEPYIDAATMILHHDVHLQTYVDNLNNILKDYPQYWNMTLTELIEDVKHLPYEIQDSVRNNAGGVYNHIMFFRQMKPSSEEAGMEDRAEETTDEMKYVKEEFKKAALSVFGSGNAWIVIDRLGKPRIVITKNQDNPIESGLKPVLILDVWEHAYYLKHYNRREDYIEDWFKVVNIDDRMS